MVDKILTWLFFSVIIALIPILFPVIPRRARGQNFYADDLIGNGELLIVSAALSASATGELVNGVSRFTTLNVFVIGITIITLLITTMTFTHLDSSKYNSDISAIDRVFVAKASIGLFIASLISSGMCIAIGR